MTRSEIVVYSPFFVKNAKDKLGDSHRRSGNLFFNGTSSKQKILRNSYPFPKRQLTPHDQG